MKIELELPNEFIEMCANDDVEPSAVIKGFIADLAEIRGTDKTPSHALGYTSNGSDERLLANQYYDRVGYNWID